jgi:redox-sensitive bicupin YhaK (pirin superfamily)
MLLSNQKESDSVMITIRKANDRGHADHGWLNSWHTFSFASYFDPAHMGFRSLRVINDDRVAPGKGFGSHGHRDMEIISYVLEGSLAHKDSMGQSHVIGPNAIQAMSAGTGIVHSEFNPSAQELVHFLQIWIEPAVEDVKPSYYQMSFDPREKQGKLRLLAAPYEDGAEVSGAAPIHQDARIWVSELGASESLTHDLAPGRFGYMQVARGNVTLNGQKLGEGDGASITNESALMLVGAGSDGGEFILFDLA